MLRSVHASALTASSVASFAANELVRAGFHEDAAGVQRAAEECVGPLLKGAMIAIDLAGPLPGTDPLAALRGAIADYLETPGRLQPAIEATAVAIGECAS